LMARDPALAAAAERGVVAGRPAPAALLAAAEERVAPPLALDDPTLSQRADDPRSVGRRAARLAAGVAAEVPAAPERTVPGAAARWLAHEERGLPAATRDGRLVRVLANVASRAEVRTALAGGAEGVGLLRTEMAFLAAGGWPGQTEHERALRPVLEALAGRVA